MNAGAQLRADSAPDDASAGIQPAPLVVAIILNWNKDDLTLETLASLREQTYAHLQTLALDNGSDNQQEALARIRTAFPEVRTLASKRNLGFAGGCNVGMRAALELGAEYLLLLNNDVLLQPDAIAELVAALQGDASAGAAGPLIYYASEPERVWFGGGKVRMGGRVLPEHGEDAGIQRGSPTMESAWLPGTAMLVRREAVARAGLMDAGYFLYWEDVEWCFRLRSAGYRLLIVPRSVIYHKVNATSGDLPLTIVYYWERNRLRFIERWGTWRSRITAWGKVAWRCVFWRIKPPDDPHVKVKLEAYRDYLLRRGGPRQARARAEPAAMPAEFDFAPRRGQPR
ncbi:MAG TPA: glycosyltransferase family 2 protein [Chloroflexia bacterium]|nr:glycosyltransferase family 2 protein [Chloroflexia bacterium]